MKEKLYIKHIKPKFNIKIDNLNKLQQLPKKKNYNKLQRKKNITNIIKKRKQTFYSIHRNFIIYMLSGRCPNLAHIFSIKSAFNR